MNIIKTIGAAALVAMLAVLWFVPALLVWFACVAWAKTSSHEA